MSEHYFSPRPGAPHRPGRVRVVLPDVYLELATDAGVFSPGRLDPGTRLLLDEAPVPPRLAGIWSNPPIRIGKAALHELLSAWLGRLAGGGQASLVAGRNLGADSLHRWLTEQGWQVTRRAARNGYRLLQVEFLAERAVVTPP